MSEDTTEQPTSGQPHTTSMTQSPTDIGAHDIESWNTLEVPQVKFPRIDYMESEEDLSDGSSTSGQMPIGRPSYVYLTTNRTGVEMDAATKIANEALQRGKEALEAAGNMKRECKQIAIDCLQTLYETILSLSDSRSRHKFNLEKERHHHAKEIVSIERAHNKQLVTSVQEINKKLDDTQNILQQTKEETQTIRSWLGYETREPYQQIKETAQKVTVLEHLIKELNNKISAPSTDKTKVLEERASTHFEKLSNQLDSIRRKVDNTEGQITRLISARPSPKPNPSHKLGDRAGASGAGKNCGPGTGSLCLIRANSGLTKTTDPQPQPNSQIN